MYQVEIKLSLVKHKLKPKLGWQVNVDLDGMEMGKGNQHPPGKAEIAAQCRLCLESDGALIGPDPQFGRADLVARHPEHGTYVVEAEGDSSKQKDQAMYSALGQLLLVMTVDSADIRYAVAVPDDPGWERQVSKIPLLVMDRLGLDILLVSSSGVRPFRRAST